ncbi:MAG: hypothetical protein ACI865_002985 [Flavobacteriaceae bacterium]|jgi:hypothetical protein
MRFTQLAKSVRITLIIQSISMLMGASTHITWGIKNGFLSEHYHASIGTALFWDSLTFLDPLAALLLIIRSKSGLLLTTFIIIVDVLHNNLFYADELYFTPIPIGTWLATYWMILGQMIFLLFVLVTLKRNWRAVNETD